MRTIFLSVIVGLFALPLCAHEFWIDPVKFHIDHGDNIDAHFKVGQNFKGSNSSFLQPRTTRHEVGQNGMLTPVPARSGDRPAMQIKDPDAGLIVLVHETDDSTLTYHEWEKFVNFVDHKAFADALDQHQNRGLPRVGFKETYRRYAKSLIAVGDGIGTDFDVGLKIEIVALANPYTADVSNGLPVRVMLDGTPRANAQVELFEKPTDIRGAANLITTYRTNADGVVILPVQRGHRYMVDSVALLPVYDGDVVWHSIWANLTFAVP